MRATLILLFITITLSFLSCTKKQDPIITPIGSISFTGIRDADTLKGTISAQITVAGTVQPQKIEVYANDSLIATGNKAPYNLQWNTLGVINGNYKLKAIAYDNAGKQTLSVVSVIVQNTLITLKITPKINSLYNNVMYIVTDSAGNILNSIKYNGTDSYLLISANRPYIKQRFNVFEVKTYINTYITAYLNIPRGSTWDLTGITVHDNPKLTGTQLNFTDIPSFSRIIMGSDVFGYSLINGSDFSIVKNYVTSPTGKELVQFVDNDNNGYYNFFDVDTIQKSNTIDLANNQFHPSIKKTVTVSGSTSGDFSVYGRSDTKYDSFYLVDASFYQGSTFSYFYPDGGYLTDFKSEIYYNKDGWSYANVYTGLLPQTIAPFGTTVNINNNTLDEFNFSAQGSFDYYDVNFSDVTDKVNIEVYSTSPYQSFKFPDILKLTNIPTVSLSQFKIFSFAMFKTPGFDESKLFYYNNDYPSLTVPSQWAIKYFTL